jgi:hypothetical protein
MNKKTYFFLLSILACSSVLPLLAFEPEEFPITNSSFENGMKPWSWGVSGNTFEATGDIVGDQARTGSTSFQITCKSSRTEGMFASLALPLLNVKPGRYRLSLWVKGLNVVEPDAVQVTLDKSWSHRANFPAGTFDWTEICVDYVVANDSENINAYVLINSSAEKIWVDDVTFTRIGDGVGVINPGFEEEIHQNDLYPWQWSVVEKVKASGSVVKNASHAHEGKASFEITFQSALSSNSYLLARLYQTIKGVKPGNYRFSVWAKGKEVSSPKAIQLTVDNKWTERVNFPDGDFDWKEISIDYEVTEESEDVSLNILIQGPVENLWVDDASFTSLKP